MALKLDPEYAAAVAPLQDLFAARPAPPVHDVQGRRDGLKMFFDYLYSKVPPVPDVQSTDYTFKSYDGVELVISRIWKTGSDAAPGPAILHVHGGGMIAGDIKTFGHAIRQMASATGVQYFDVEYRLAPEAKHTSLVDDCYAGLLWLHEHAAEFNVDKARIGVQGESAGGGIAAGLALMARDKKLSPPLAKQILIYPMIDYKNTKPVSKELTPFLFWTVESNITGWYALLGDRMESGDVSPYASPTYAKDLAGLPSTYMDCGVLDLFRDEDTEFARRLAAADIDVEYHLYPGVPHGFEAIGGPNVGITKQAVANRLRALKSF